MKESPQFFDVNRINLYVKEHGIEPLAINEKIGETPFVIPLVYDQDGEEHIVYFEDEPWEDEQIYRLLEWTLMLRFFSDHRQAKIILESPPAPDLVKEIVSYEPVVLAKLAAIMGVLLVEDMTPPTLVEVARRWLGELFRIELPSTEAGSLSPDLIDHVALQLNQIIEDYFWADGRWQFHPLEYLLLLGAAFGELIRLRYGGTWFEGDTPIESGVRIMNRLDFYPAQGILEMLREGPSASIWELYQLIPIELESSTDNSGNEVH